MNEVKTYSKDNELIIELVCDPGLPTDISKLDELIKNFSLCNEFHREWWMKEACRTLVNVKNLMDQQKPVLDVGSEMINMTTTVWYQEEWPAIPGLWLKCMEERDEALAKLKEIEKQEPVGTLFDDGYYLFDGGKAPYESHYAGTKYRFYIKQPPIEFKP